MKRLRKEHREGRHSTPIYNCPLCAQQNLREPMIDHAEKWAEEHLPQPLDQYVNGELEMEVEG